MIRLAALAVALMFALPATARANGYYLSKHEAESITRNFLHQTLGYHYTAAACRPQGRSAPEKGYIYHRWVCGWIVGDDRDYDDCRGRSRVSGSSDSSKFYWFVLRHTGDCQYGWK